MIESLPGAVIFYALAALTIGGAMWVAFSRNIVHSAFALLGTLVGAAGLYAYLSAELLVVLQAMIYIGGVLVLILFAVMLTSRIADVRLSNPSLGRLPGAVFLVLIAGAIGFMAFGVFGDAPKNESAITIYAIGNALLGAYLLPFHIMAIVLLAVMVGAVGMARGVRLKVLKGAGAPDNERDPLERTGDSSDFNRTADVESGSKETE
jgi:NAD(P)H-quinone oxidoreductase subunit 6